MRLAFFGGTFDPPHRGHLSVARAAAERFSLQTVLFAPTARQPLKPQETGASFAARLDMVRLLCAAENSHTRGGYFTPSELDGPRDDGRPNYTIDTLRRLRTSLEEQLKGAEELKLFSIVGADAFIDFRRWREPDALLEAAEWIVVSRPGFSLADLTTISLTPVQRAHVHVLEGIEEPVSATEVRRRLEDGLDCSDLLTPEVIDYIREHQLYSSGIASGKN